MRKYQIIWIKIRDTGECTIAANPAIHARLKKAITKEKYKDTVYRIQFDLLDTTQPHLEVTHPVDYRGSPNKNALRFKLIKPITVGDL